MNAPDKATEIKVFITAVIAFGTSLWGATGWGVLILFVCIALDYITGTCAALKMGQWSSKVAREGLWHKLGELTALLVAMLSDIAFRVIISVPAKADVLKGIPNPRGLFTMLVTVWYIFTELGSVIENASNLGAPIPEWLRKMIEKTREKIDSDIYEDDEIDDK